MDLDPQLPPLPTLTPISTLQNIPDIPSEPSISVLFPEITPYRVLNNPFRGPFAGALNETHKSSLSEALSDIRSPFLFTLNGPLTFDGKPVGDDTTTDNFNAAAITVIAALERGYYPARDHTPLSTSDWAQLACALIAAVGRGYHCQYITTQESTLDKARAEATDSAPLAPGY